MRRPNELEVEITVGRDFLAKPPSEKSQMPRALRLGDGDEIWLVPMMFDAVCDDARLAYRVEIKVDINPETSIAEIWHLSVVQREHGDPVHAAGLRTLPLAAILQTSVREAAVFMTKDKNLRGYVQTKPAKMPGELFLAQATDRRARSKRRKNAPQASEAAVAKRLVDGLRRSGVRSWQAEACRQLGVSRATLYRRLGMTAPAKPKPKPKPKTKKRGKR